MRKKYRQQRLGKQLLLFKEEQVNLRPKINTPSGNRDLSEESKYFSLLAKNRALTETLLNEVMSVTNLNKAYVRVKRNDGIAGTDGMTTTELTDWLKSGSQQLIKEVLTEKYTPSTVLGLEIPKASGGKRTLGIPTVKDRLIQQAINQSLTKLYEPLFSDSSYGFRPNRSAHQALIQASEYVLSGREWVVDIDLENFFDKINQDRLMQRLSKGIGDKRLLRLINKYLKSGMLKGGLIEQRTSGTPQGGPLSPLLSNIVLDELDKELEKRGHQFVRYADDCNIYVRSKRGGERVLDSIGKFIEGKLKLKINKNKSGVRHCKQVTFLGYTIEPSGKLRVAAKSLKKFKHKVRSITARSRGKKFSSIIKELNTMTRGWINYFRLANYWAPWKTLDGWIRRRLRCYRLRQCKRKYTLFKFLHGLGAEKQKAWNTALYYGSWWSKSYNRTCQKVMNKDWFDRLGLYPIEGLHQRLKC